MINRELEQQFYEANRSIVLPFVVNDSVEVIEGNHKGKVAAVISIHSSEPELTYFIEFGDGSGDLEISANHLRLMP